MNGYFPGDGWGLEDYPSLKMSAGTQWCENGGWPLIYGGFSRGHEH
jgi:hypothetical protein